MATGSGGGAAAVVEADISPRVILYKRVASPAERETVIDDANALIMAVANLRGAPAGSQCHFELSSAADRVTLSITGHRYYIQQAVALSRTTGWRRNISVVETVLVRPIAVLNADPEPASAVRNRSHNVSRLHNPRTTRRAEGFPKQGRLSQVAALPQMRGVPLEVVARAFSEVSVPQYVGRPPRTPENALREGRQVAWEERNTRRNTRRLMGRARLSSSNSSSNTE
jgi:hypothetical protein